MLNLFKKKIIIKIKYSRSWSDLGNSWCGPQQPFFFLVFTDFQTLQENTGKLKLVDLKQDNQQ